MQKFISIFVIVALVLSLVACTSESSDSDITTTSAEIVSVTEKKSPVNEKTDVEILIEKFRSNEWDGSQIILNDRQYIERDRGILEVIDGEVNDEILGFVDIPEGVKGRHLLYNRSNGTYVYDETDNKVHLYFEGRLQASFDNFLDTDLSYGHVRCYDLNGGNFILHKDSSLAIIQIYENKLMIMRTDVVDTYEGADCVLFSDFQGDNWKISPDGKVSGHATKYIKFPSEMQMTQIDNRYAKNAYEGLGRSFYVGGAIDDGRYVDLYANDNHQTYTMVYRDPGAVKLISENVLDAEYEVGSMIFYDGEAVYKFNVKTKAVEKIHDGKIKCLVETWTEDDLVEIVF